MIGLLPKNNIRDYDFLMSKTTGFTSPAQGYEARDFDFNEILVKHPHATFIFRSDTSVMAKHGVFKGSLLVVDRSVDPVNGSLVLAELDGLFLCRELVTDNGKPGLTDGIDTIFPSKDGELTIYGTVTAVVTLK